MTRTSRLFLRYTPIDVECIRARTDCMQSPLGYWQTKCWDPAVNSDKFETFCASLSKPFGRFSAQSFDLHFEHPERLVTLDGGFAVDIAIVNYGKWVKEVGINAEVYM